MSVSVVDSNRSRERGIDRLFFSWFARWIEFWFTPADPTPLCVIRWLIGGMVLYSTYVWGMELDAFFGRDGWNSLEVIRAYQFNQFRPSLWWLVPEASMYTAHQCCLAILALFWIGFCTRVTSILALVIHISYCDRALIATFGLDQICGVLLLYLAIGPSGARYSVDSILIRLWRRIRNGSQVAETPQKFASACLATRLMQVHYCVIYFYAAIGKFQGESWWDGTALWRAFANYEYQSIDMTWLAHFPELLQLVTHIAIVWELSFAYLIWVKPLRPLMLFFGVLVHFGIGAFLGMWTFGLAMIFGYVCFLEPDTVRAALRLPLRLIGRV